jgi:glycosyltransferase involved in cell wall biosynthesis
MDSPLVSVCVITYNHVQYIEQALESVLMQKVNFPWEIIIADDCSTDGTRDIVAEYGRKFPEFIRLISRERNVGPGLNFVELINAAKGKYIAYLEGDDYWIDENKLKIQFNLLESDLSISMCYHKIKWENNRNSNSVEENKYSNENDPPISTINDVLDRGWFIRSCSMFFRAEKLPPNFELLYIGDYPLHVIMATKGNIAFINKPMGVYRIHNQGYSEQNLQTIDFNKRKNNFHNELKVYSFLNDYSEGKYLKKLLKKKFDITYSYLSFVFKIHRGFFFQELYSTSRMFPFTTIVFLIINKLMKK